MGTVLKMTGIAVLGVLLAALLWLFGASDVFASTDPMSVLEQQLQTPSPDVALLENMLKQQKQEKEVRDETLQIFFPDLHFLEPAMLGEADLQRELAELNE